MDELARFARAKALFDAVCDLPEAEREAYLAASGTDIELLGRVRALLVRDIGDTQRFAAPIAGLLGALSGAEELQAGTVLGAWTLTEKVGEGGMGTVYAARRSDGHFEQIAAIKVLRGVPSPAGLEFLARERQILASLAHPNIARLLDGGSTPQGQPYLVMEFLDGIPIDRYCRDQALPIANVLGLLVQICDAVSFAHACLVVHCDLKPSNILVDAGGRPWLLDFGIARLLGNESSEDRPSSISQRARAFTPGFASPEQERGGVVSTVSDVYSLGRLFEELIGAARLASAAELRAIAQRATREDPAARYASAAALSQDFERYLAHQPVKALPPTLAYHGRKWLQRRWPVALAAAIFALTVLGFTLQLVAERDRALAAEQQALAERDRATQAEQASRQISAFLVSILDGANPDAGSGEIPTSKLVEQALARIDTELAGQPAVQSELYGKLAGVQRVLGNPELAQTSYQKAIDLARPLGRPLVLAELLTRLAELRRASFRSADAVAVARESLRIYEQNATADPAGLADATQLLGQILSDEGASPEGESLLRLALQRQEVIDPAGTADALEALAGQQLQAAADGEAETLLRRSLKLRSAVGSDPEAALNATEMLGRTLGKLRRTDEAETLLREALAQRRQLFGDDDVNIPWRLSELAAVLDNSGRTLQALPLHREALAIAERKMGINSVAYAVFLNNIALAKMRVGNYVESERDYRRAIAIVTVPWGEHSSGLATLRYNLGTLLSKTRPAEAEPLLTAAEAYYAGANPAAHRDVIASRTLLAVLQLKLRQPVRARQWLEQVDAAKPQMTPLQKADREFAWALLAAQEGHRDDALAGLQRSEAMRLAALGADDARIWLAKIERAELLAERGSIDERNESAVLAAEILAKLDGPLVPDSPVRERLAKLL